MSNLIVSSIAEPEIWAFSARHVNSAPRSSIVARIVSRLVVTLPSIDTCSWACFSRLLPSHHVIVAGGREPEEIHVTTDSLSADRAFLSLVILTVSGRTRKKDNEKNMS